LDRSRHCDGTLPSSDERFEKSDEWYAAEELFREAFFAAHPGILWFSGESIQQRYVIWNSRVRLPEIR
jgi:hypothetical protein